MKKDLLAVHEAQLAKKETEEEEALEVCKEEHEDMKRRISQLEEKVVRQEKLISRYPVFLKCTRSASQLSFTSLFL